MSAQGAPQPAQGGVLTKQECDILTGDLTPVHKMLKKAFASFIAYRSGGTWG
jgi:hypothetical protein